MTSPPALPLPPAYGDPGDCLNVAPFTGLADLRRLEPARHLQFLPLE